MGKIIVTRPPDDEQDWDRELAAMTLQQAWAVVTRAWRDRRRYPTDWKLIANNVNYARRQQQQRKANAK